MMNISVTLPTILIVENDPATLELYRRELGREYWVFACLSKSETLDAIDSQSPKAIILEPVGVNEDGWDLLHTIASTPKTG